MAHDDYDHLRESADNAVAARMEKVRNLAWKAITEAAAKHYNEEYGYPDATTLFPAQTDDDRNCISCVKEGTTDNHKSHPQVHGYAPTDITRDNVPLAADLTQFVVWLRDSTDFFSGPNLDMDYPRAEDPDFYEVLAQNALEYTGE